MRFILSLIVISLLVFTIFPILRQMSCPLEAGLIQERVRHWSIYISWKNATLYSRLNRLNLCNKSRCNLFHFLFNFSFFSSKAGHGSFPTTPSFSVPLTPGFRVALYLSTTGELTESYPETFGGVKKMSHSLHGLLPHLS